MIQTQLPTFATEGISLLLVRPLAACQILQHNRIIGLFSLGHAEVVKIAQRKLKAW